MGVTVSEQRDRLTVVGLTTQQPAADGDDTETDEGEAGEESAPDTVSTEPENVIIDSRSDHRIAMAFGVLGAAVGGVTIDGAECVDKTYPGFWDILKSIGGKLEINAE